MIEIARVKHLDANLGTDQLVPKREVGFKRLVLMREVGFKRLVLKRVVGFKRLVLKSVVGFKRMMAFLAGVDLADSSLAWTFPVSQGQRSGEYGNFLYVLQNTAYSLEYGIHEKNF